MNGIQIGRLSGVAIFAGMNDRSLQLMLEPSQPVSLAAGSYFFREGDQADSFFQLWQGTVSVQRRWKGRSLVLGELNEGDCFGEMALIDCQSRSASIVANSDCQAIEIPAVSLRLLLADDLEQYAIIMMNLGREVSRRLRSADDRLLEMLYYQTQ